MGTWQDAIQLEWGRIQPSNEGEVSESRQWWPRDVTKWPTCRQGRNPFICAEAPYNELDASLHRAVARRVLDVRASDRADAATIPAAWHDTAPTKAGAAIVSADDAASACDFQSGTAASSSPRAATSNKGSERTVGD